MNLDNFLSNYIQTTDYPTLDAMIYLMKKLDNPEKKLKFVHIAGTNGKGSICEMVNQILINSNYKVGKFISPHLFESNESMYKDVSANREKYDVLVPSDYMIDRLIQEGLVEKIDKSNIKNLSNIAKEYLYPAYDPQNDYVVPYMVGTVGILYNKAVIKDPVDSWDIMWDSRYSGQI